MITLKTGPYRVSVWDKKLEYIETDQKDDVDISYAVKSFEPFFHLGVDTGGDVINLIEDNNKGSFIFVRFPVTGGSLEPKINLGDVFNLEDVKVIKTYIKKEKKEMEERYDVFDGAFKVASDMKLEVALCLIKAYVKEYGSEIKGGISLVSIENNKSA